MKIREFDDPYYVEGNDYDDTIINDDPFADAFGTPDMYRPDPKKRRYSEEELGKMSVKECGVERLKCSKDKNASSTPCASSPTPTISRNSESQRHH